MAAALVLRRTVTKGAPSGFIMETAQISDGRRCATSLLGLWQRAWIFLRRAGTIIFTVTVVLWVLLSFPQRRAGREPGRLSIAGQHRQRARGRGRADRLQPRHRAGADPGDGGARGRGRRRWRRPMRSTPPRRRGGGKALIPRLQAKWSLPTALAFLLWFVFAPQCMSTIAVTRRETNGWKWPAFMLATCSRWPTSSRGSLTGRRSPLGL